MSDQTPGSGWANDAPDILARLEADVAAAKAARHTYDAILLRVAKGLTGRGNGPTERAAADQMLRGYIGACVTPVADLEAAETARRDAAATGPAAEPWWKDRRS